MRIDRTIYEWEQSIDEVVMFIEPPKGVMAKHLDIEISPKRLRVGIKGNPPFLNLDLFSEVFVESSVWTLGMSRSKAF